ncbi:MAG: hypothetical protein AB3N18_11305 [Allomuricauda sp.]
MENNDMELVATDSHSGILEYEASIISDTKALGKFYSRINKTRKPGLSAPSIDFSKNTLLVICMGEQNGTEKPLLKKTEDKDNVLITIELPEYLDNAPNKETFTSYPFYIYKLPHTSKTVNIQKSGF